MTAGSPPTQIVEGVLFSVVVEPQIRVYSLQTFSSRAIDCWIDHVISGLMTCSSPNIYRVIYDFSDISLYALKAFRAYSIGSLGMTIAGQNQVRAFMAEKPAVAVKLAIVTHPTLSARVIRKINRHQIDVPFGFFMSSDRAISWLRSEVPTHA